MTDLDKLEELAKAATPGQWTADCCAAANMVYGPSDSIGVDAVRADAEFIAAANPAAVLALIAAHRDALEALARSKRGGKTLGEMIKQQCDDIVKITDSAHLIDETGDGDWGAVWERGFDLRADLDAALARIARVEALHRRFGIFELEDSCPDTSDEHREEHHRECADEVGEFYCDQMPVGAVCDECRTEDGERVEWPCLTVRALTEGENDGG